MDYNTGSLRVSLSEIYTTVLSCAEGVVPVHRYYPDYFGEPDDPDNQDISDEPDESSTDEVSD